MAIDLTKPLAWKKADADEAALLQNLQGNILKGHGRDYVTALFIEFTGAPEAARIFLRQIAAERVRSALDQLVDAEQYRETREPGAVFVGLLLSAQGYAFLGVPEERRPSSLAFREGLKGRPGLADPPVEQWDKELAGPIHAMVLIADDLQARVDHVRHEIEEALTAAGAGTIVAREDGQAMYNRHRAGIEHFGYVDGRSQPLMLQEDIDAEQARGGTDQWNPAFGIGTALVPDPGGPGATSFGSYLVFRKLEQNVRGFKRAEERLAKRLGLTGARAELAGALVVGRFEDGTPVVLHDDERGLPVPNNFGFDGDPAGGKCPFHAHIRKVNPRGDSVRQLETSLDEERSHLMPRRGIPYGHRLTHPNDPSLEDHPELLPARGVGLLFMAYNADLERQFEFTQASFANSPDFAGGTGIDGVIGQGKNPPRRQRWPKRWGQPRRTPAVGFNFAGFVTMRGGEYFFAPCLSVLRSL